MSHAPRKIRGFHPIRKATRVFRTRGSTLMRLDPDRLSGYRPSWSGHTDLWSPSALRSWRTGPRIGWSATPCMRGYFCWGSFVPGCRASYTDGRSYLAASVDFPAGAGVQHGRLGPDRRIPRRAGSEGAIGVHLPVEHGAADGGGERRHLRPEQDHRLHCQRP